MARQNDILANFSGTTGSVVSLVAKDIPYSVSATKMSPSFCVVQNVGTVPVYMRCSEAEVADQVTTSNYTLILAAGSTANDGTGGTFDIGGFTGFLTFISSSTGGKVNVAYGGRQGE
jgi:hypothetical protein